MVLLCLALCWRSRSTAPRTLHSTIRSPPKSLNRAIAAGEASPGERLSRQGPGRGPGREHQHRASRCAFCATRASWSFVAGRGVTVAGTLHDGAVIEKVRELLEFAAFFTDTGAKTSWRLCSRSRSQNRAGSSCPWRLRILDSPSRQLFAVASAPRGAISFFEFIVDSTEATRETPPASVTAAQAGRGCHDRVDREGTVEQHHRDAIERWAEAAADDDEVLALVVAGSLTKG